MGRIFISAAHGGREGGRIDPGSIAGGTTEAREMILLLGYQALNFPLNVTNFC